MKIPLILGLACLLCSGVMADENLKITGTRMNGRTSADISYKFFYTLARNNNQSVKIEFTAGLGHVWWDGDERDEGRLHADVSLGINSFYWSIGPILTSGTKGGVAAGLRTMIGYQFRSRVFAGAYWEFVAGLPFSDRGSRSGIGIQAGFSF